MQSLFPPRQYEKGREPKGFLGRVPGTPYLSITSGPGFLGLSGRCANRSSRSIKASSPTVNGIKSALTQLIRNIMHTPKGEEWWGECRVNANQPSTPNDLNSSILNNEISYRKLSRSRTIEAEFYLDFQLPDEGDGLAEITDTSRCIKTT